MPIDVAARVTAAVSVPTIGIGAGVGCDGQVLVGYDMLGLFRGIRPVFVKRYGEFGDDVVNAARIYADDVRRRVFPGPEHGFGARESAEKFATNIVDSDGALETNSGKR